MTCEFERYQRYLDALRPRGRHMTQAQLLELRGFIRDFERAAASGGFGRVAGTPKISLRIWPTPAAEAEVIRLDEARARRLAGVRS